jgi:peptide/nickel transport system substrate-binding protein
MRNRLARFIALAALIGAVSFPTSASAGVEGQVLRVGTTQDFDASNPYQTALVSGFEAFQLTYNLLVDFGYNLEPVPGFAESWERAPDRVTFKIREGMLWSDDEPATSADACFSWQLALDAIADDSNIGLGYLDTNLKDAGVTKVECPDATTMIAYTEDQSDRVFQAYLPILPEHIWGEMDYEEIGEESFDAPLVGTGPYTLAEWRTGEFMRFERNENYWGNEGFADEVVLQVFGTSDSMVQALRSGALDYASGPNADQLKDLQEDEGFETVVGSSNGWTQLAFNTYGTGTGKTIEDGGPSTQALLDPLFRDALGYAVDKPLLVDRVLGGFGDVGTTIVPPVLGNFHVEPTTPRTFDLALAAQKLEAAGYPLDANGNRLDKEGKPITLRLYMPDSDETYASSGEFIKDWYGELGITVEPDVFDSDTLVDIVLPPEAGEKYKADYDIELWGWSGSPDPNALLSIFRCDEIGNTSDSQYCNPEYDALYDQQSALTGDARAAILAQMQNLIYDQAVYDILYYDAALVAYRTDRFAGWRNMPENGTPLFTYGTLGYTLLTDATAAPTPGPTGTGGPTASGPAASGSAATPSPSGSPTANPGGGDMTPVLLIVGAALVAVVGGALYMNRRRSAAAVEDE